MARMSRRIAWNLLRIALTAFFILLVVRMIHFQDYVKDGEMREGFFTLVGKIEKLPALGLAALFVIPLFFGALRWWLLMRAAGVPAPLGRVMCVSYSGAFFNLFLPGSVGGDIAKAVLAAKGEERKTAIVGTIILDRVVGLVMMIFLAAAVVIPQIGNPNLRQPVIIILSLFGAFVFGYLIYFSPLLRSTRFGGWLKSKLPFQRTLRELDVVFTTARKAKGTLVLAALLSFAGQVTVILLLIGLSRAMGMTRPSVSEFFLFEPILFIIAAIPISLGGWGVGEAAYAYFFAMVGVPVDQAIALSVLAKLAMMFAALPGGLLFAFGFAGRRDSREGAEKDPEDRPEPKV